MAIVFNACFFLPFERRGSVFCISRDHGCHARRDGISLFMRFSTYTHRMIYLGTRASPRHQSMMRLDRLLSLIGRLLLHNLNRQPLVRASGKKSNLKVHRTKI
jgi:hypothetical protein